MSQVRRRPSILSYFSFSRDTKATTRYSRSDSVTANLRHDDPYEKADRHSSSGESSPGIVANGGNMTNSGRARLLKTVCIVGLFFLALWVFLPAGSRENAEQVLKDTDHAEKLSHLGGEDFSESKPSSTPPPPVKPVDDKPSVKTPNQGQSAIDAASGTTKCTKSSSFSKPIVQYALMVDAGSTGSRIHVYRFNNCGETPELESEIFNITKPGLSSYGPDAEGAAQSLDVLMDVAVKHVPESLKSCTPVAVKATAGLRLLGKDKSKRILDAVRHRFETKYPFPVVPGDGVSIMDGKDEGVYAWITTNYLTGKIGTVDKTPTAAIFDLGGASTQIVFEPTFPSINGGMPETLRDGDHKYELTFGGRHFILYQHSHLGYGLMEARKAIHQHVYTTSKKELGAAFDLKKIVNPCIAPGMSRTVNITADTTSDPPTLLEVTMVGPSTGSSVQCRGIAESILKKNAPCSVTPCSFNGIHQPHLARTFAREDIYIFSYFYDRTVPIGMPEDFSIAELKDVTGKVCAGDGPAWEAFAAKEGALEELRDRPEHCLDLSFMIALLHTGYEMPVDRELKVAKKIGENELGWCLGASLPLLDQGNGGWTCRVQEIS